MREPIVVAFCNQTDLVTVIVILHYLPSVVCVQCKLVMPGPFSCGRYPSLQVYSVNLRFTVVNSKFIYKYKHAYKNGYDVYMS